MHHKPQLDLSPVHSVVTLNTDLFSIQYRSVQVYCLDHFVLSQHCGKCYHALQSLQTGKSIEKVDSVSISLYYNHKITI